MKCIKCNANIPDNSMFCNFCGAVQKQKAGWKCSCGAENEDDYNFCMKCGSPKVIENEISDDRWICACGAENDDDYNFCMKCGSRKPTFSPEEEPEENETDKDVCEESLLSEDTDYAEESEEPFSEDKAIDDETWDDAEGNNPDTSENDSHADDVIDESEFFTDGIDIFTSRWLCKCGAVNNIDYAEIDKGTELKCEKCGEPFGAEKHIKNAVVLNNSAIPIPDAPPEFYMPI